MSLLLNVSVGSFLLIFCSSARGEGVSVFAGSLLGPGGVEVGVSFAGPVDKASIPFPDNFQLSGGSIGGLRFDEETGSVVLETSGLQTGRGYTVTVSNVADLSGNPVPATTLSFTVRPISWGPVGQSELGFAPAAVAIGGSGFDLRNGGIQFWDVYDEATFVYEAVTGDFDKKVRIESQDASSPFARAGLMARETLDLGKPRPANPDDPSQAFSRYVAIQADPVLTADGSPANNQFEITRRLFTGGIGRLTPDPTESLPISENAAPAYPNAWVRLKRGGDTFSMYSSNNGKDWTLLGTTAFPTTDANGSPVPPFPKTVFVGPVYGSENGNIPLNSGLRADWLARFRDYGDANSGGDPGESLAIERRADGLFVRWTGPGTLQKSPSVFGPWGNVDGAASPYSVPPGQSAQYFRLKL